MRFIYEMCAKVGTCYFILFNRYFCSGNIVDRHINCLQNKSFMFKCGKVSDSMPDFLFSNQKTSLQLEKQFPDTVCLYWQGQWSKRGNTEQRDSLTCVANCLSRIQTGNILLTALAAMFSRKHDVARQSLLQGKNFAIKRKEVNTCMQTSVPIIPQYEAGGLVQRRQA